MIQYVGHNVLRKGNTCSLKLPTLPLLPFVSLSLFHPSFPSAARTKPLGSLALYVLPCRGSFHPSGLDISLDYARLLDWIHQHSSGPTRRRIPRHYPLHFSLAQHGFHFKGWVFDRTSLSEASKRAWGQYDPFFDPSSFSLFFFSPPFRSERLGQPWQLIFLARIKW